MFQQLPTAGLPFPFERWDELDAGRELPMIPPWFAQENKWRAARYGMDAVLILDKHGNEDVVTDDIVRHGASYQRQRAVIVAKSC